MDNNSKKLVEVFRRVHKQGWIQDIGQSWGGIGLTFEKAIGKLPDSKYEPDFNDIEIKCSSRYSRYPVYLFTIAFDGPRENEIMRIVDKFGFYDPDFPDKKVLFRKITNYNNESNKYNFQFDIDRQNEKIYLCVFDSNGVLIERSSYLHFSTLKNHLYKKLRKLAYIKASTKKVDGIKYYRYYSIKLFFLKSFETFLELMEKDVLEIWIVSRINKSGKDKGRYRNKNIEFSIKEQYLEQLFDNYYKVNYDTYYEH